MNEQKTELPLDALVAELRDKAGVLRATDTRTTPGVIVVNQVARALDKLADSIAEQSKGAITEDSIREAIGRVEQQGPCLIHGAGYAAHRLADAEMGQFFAGDSLEVVLDSYHENGDLTEMFSRWIAVAILTKFGKLADDPDAQPVQAYQGPDAEDILTRYIQSTTTLSKEAAQTQAKLFINTEDKSCGK